MGKFFLSPRFHYDGEVDRLGTRGLYAGRVEKLFISKTEANLQLVPEKTRSNPLETKGAQ